MSSRGSKRGGRGGKATSGGRYFTGDGAAADAKAITKEVKNKKLQKDVQVAATPAAAVNAGKKGQKRKGAPEVATAQKEQTKKVAPTPTATAEGGKKGQKRKGSPAAKKEQTKKAVVAEEASPQQPRKQRKPKAERMGKRAWEEDEEKVEKVTEAAPEVEDDDSDVDSEVSLPSDSEDSDFEQVVAKESGSARFKAALALRDTFQNFREENAEDEDDEDEDESEDEEEIKKRTQKLGDYVSLKSDSDDGVVVEDYFNADAEVDDDDDDAEEDNAEQKPEGEGKTTAKPEQAKSKAGDVKQKEKKTTDVKKKEKKGKVGQPAAKKRRVNARSLNLNLRGTGAVYLGHLPSGFYKEQMQGFFSQFGRVLRISHPLSKKTGRSKGYAFILFEHKEVAQVVAETMHGYLISNRILRCKYIPSTQIPKHMFKNAQTAYPSFDRRQAEAEKRGTVRSATKHKKLTKSLVSKENKRRQKLKALGFDYDFPGYAAAVAETTKAKQ